MLQAIGEVLGNAVGVAISPLPVIALILVLFSRRATVNSLAFALGWVLALSVIGAVVLALDFSGSDEDPSTASGIVKLTIGSLLLLLAGRQWGRRPRDGAEPALPPWLDAVDGFSPARSFGTAMLLAGVNPKNLGMTVAAATSIGAQELTVGGQVITMGVFVLLASATIIGPVAYSVVAGASAERALQSARSWLAANNATVMTVLFLVLGAKTLGEGLAILG